MTPFIAGADRRGDRPGREVRQVAFEELRVARADGEQPVISGYGAVFGKLSSDLGLFREQIDPEAFTRTLKNRPDVFSFYNHNPDHVLGRTRAGTLELEVDQGGVRYRVTPPPAGWANDLLESIGRGDVTDASFAFRTVRDRWEQEPGQTPVRTLLEVELLEMGPVTMGAYPDASSSLRSALETAPAEIVSAVLGEPPAADPGQRSHSYAYLARRLDLHARRAGQRVRGRA